jgi:pimeloyl-ACP methyl ester carboxylesterase
MTTFGLVHGAYHGAWCWDLVAERLRAQGHTVVTPGLPCDDPTATADTYRDLVVEALGDADPVVLVGHSLGTFTISRVAAVRPVTGLVYLCMLPVGPPPALQQLPSDVMAPTFNAAERVERSDGASEFAPGAGREVFFHACDDALAVWATGKLRAQFFGPIVGAPPLEAWPDSPIAVILARDDRVIAFEPAMRAVEQIGIDPVVLPGSHSPFLDDADGLAAVLRREADSMCSG